VLFVLIFPTSDADFVGPFALLEIVRTFLMLLHQMLTESDVSLIHSQSVCALFHSLILFVDGVRLRSS